MFKIFCKYSTFLEIRREIFDIFYTHTLFSPLWHEKIPLCFLALSEAFGVNPYQPVASRKTWKQGSGA